MKRLQDTLRSSLKLEILAAVLVCFAASFGVFFASREMANRVLTRRYSRQAEFRTLNGLAGDFRRHVADNGLSVGDTQAFGKWGELNRVVVVLPGRNTGERSSGGQVGAAVRTVEDVEYRDGTFETLFIYVPDRPLETLFLILSLLFSFGAFLLLLFYFAKKKLDYMLTIGRGVEIFESGELDYRLPETGRDELGRLAASLNAMSLAMQNRILSEQRAMQAGREIIGDLSHDIRTPLTVGLSCLVMLLENEDMDKVERRRLLTLALKKTEQLNERTGELLDCATLRSGQQPVHKTTIRAVELVGQLREELTALAPLEADIVLSEEATIFGDIGLLERLFDNLLSNIRKYGDTERPLILRVRTEDRFIRIEIINVVDTDASAEGKSLGLKICACILEIHEGCFEASKENDTYRTFVSLPVSKPAV